MTSKKNNNYFRGDLWFQEQVKSRAREELSRQQESFAEEHKDDTEEQLIAYVRGFANALGYCIPVWQLGSSGQQGWPAEAGHDAADGTTFNL